MKNVVIGNVYTVKVSGRIAPVKLARKIAAGKGQVTDRFIGVNLSTGKRVTVTAGRCRSKVC